MLYKHTKTYLPLPGLPAINSKKVPCLGSCAALASSRHFTKKKGKENVRIMKIGTENGNPQIKGFIFMVVLHKSIIGALLI